MPRWPKGWQGKLAYLGVSRGTADVEHFPFWMLAPRTLIVPWSVNSFKVVGSPRRNGVFLKTDDIFMNFQKKLAKSLINNSYVNEKKCGSPSKIRKRKISQILETAPIHATDYDLKRVCTAKYKYQQYICRWPTTKKLVAQIAWEHDCAKSIILCMFWRNG